jgi:hypothetical protein
MQNVTASARITEKAEWGWLWVWVVTSGWSGAKVDPMHGIQPCWGWMQEGSTLSRRLTNSENVEMCLSRARVLILFEPFLFLTARLRKNIVRQLSWQHSLISQIGPSIQHIVDWNFAWLWFLVRRLSLEHHMKFFNRHVHDFNRCRSNSWDNSDRRWLTSVSISQSINQSITGSSTDHSVEYLHCAMTRSSLFTGVCPTQVHY